MSIERPASDDLRLTSASAKVQESDVVAFEELVSGTVRLTPARDSTAADGLFADAGLKAEGRAPFQSSSVPYTDIEVIQAFPQGLGLREQDAASRPQMPGSLDEGFLIYQTRNMRTGQWEVRLRSGGGKVFDDLLAFESNRRVTRDDFGRDGPVWAAVRETERLLAQPENALPPSGGFGTGSDFKAGVGLGSLTNLFGVVLGLPEGLGRGGLYIGQELTGLGQRLLNKVLPGDQTRTGPGNPLNAERNRQASQTNATLSAIRAVEGELAAWLNVNTDSSAYQAGAVLGGFLMKGRPDRSSVASRAPRIGGHIGVDDVIDMIRRATPDELVQGLKRVGQGDLSAGLAANPAIADALRARLANLPAGSAQAQYMSSRLAVSTPAASASAASAPAAAAADVAPIVTQAAGQTVPTGRAMHKPGKSTAAASAALTVEGGMAQPSRDRSEPIIASQQEKAEAYAAEKVLPDLARDDVAVAVVPSDEKALATARAFAFNAAQDALQRQTDARGADKPVRLMMAVPTPFGHTSVLIEGAASRVRALLDDQAARSEPLLEAVPSDSAAVGRVPNELASHSSHQDVPHSDITSEAPLHSARAALEDQDTPSTSWRTPAVAARAEEMFESVGTRQASLRETFRTAFEALARQGLAGPLVKFDDSRAVSDMRSGAAALSVFAEQFEASYGFSPMAMLQRLGTGSPLATVPSGASDGLRDALGVPGTLANAELYARVDAWLQRAFGLTAQEVAPPFRFEEADEFAERMVRFEALATAAPHITAWTHRDGAARSLQDALPRNSRLYTALSETLGDLEYVDDGPLTIDDILTIDASLRGRGLPGIDGRLLTPGRPVLSQLNPELVLSRADGASPTFGSPPATVARSDVPTRIDGDVYFRTTDGDRVRLAPSVVSAPTADDIAAALPYRDPEPVQQAFAEAFLKNGEMYTAEAVETARQTAQERGDLNVSERSRWWWERQLGQLVQDGILNTYTTSTGGRTMALANQSQDVLALGRTERQALALILSGGSDTRIGNWQLMQWGSMDGRYAKSTMQALVDAGHARKDGAKIAATLTPEWAWDQGGFTASKLPLPPSGGVEYLYIGRTDGETLTDAERAIIRTLHVGGEMTRKEIERASGTRLAGAMPDLLETGVVTQLGNARYDPTYALTKRLDDVDTELTRSQRSMLDFVNREGFVRFGDIHRAFGDASKSSLQALLSGLVEGGQIERDGSFYRVAGTPLAEARPSVTANTLDPAALDLLGMPGGTPADAFALRRPPNPQRANFFPPVLPPPPSGLSEYLYVDRQFANTLNDTEKEIVRTLHAGGELNRRELSQANPLLTWDNIAFYIPRLVELGVVTKIDADANTTTYALAPHAARVDTDLSRGQREILALVAEERFMRFGEIEAEFQDQIGRTALNNRIKALLESGAIERTGGIYHLPGAAPAVGMAEAAIVDPTRAGVLDDEALQRLGLDRANADGPAAYLRPADGEASPYVVKGRPVPPSGRSEYLYADRHAANLLSDIERTIVRALHAGGEMSRKELAALEGGPSKEAVAQAVPRLVANGIVAELGDSQQKTTYALAMHADAIDASLPRSQREILSLLDERGALTMSDIEDAAGAQASRRTVANWMAALVRHGAVERTGDAYHLPGRGEPRDGDVMPANAPEAPSASPPINEREQRLLDYVEQHGLATPGELLDVLGVTRNTMKATAAALVDAGLLQKLGPGRQPFYVPANAPSYMPDIRIGDYRIMEALRDRPMTVPEVSEATGLDDGNANKGLLRLVRAGLLERERQDGAYVYTRND